jgi:hypothetical protein
MEVNIEILKKKGKEFKKAEGRASFYDIAMEIANEHPLQASILLLATWNVGRYRFKQSDTQNLADLKNAIEKCKPSFEKIKDKDFQSTNFDEIRDLVKDIYDILSKVAGVEYTGASKIIHLFNKNLFVMWDGYIRKEYGYGVTAEDFLNFQKHMQKKFVDIEWNEPSKTLAKAIDEFNYVNYTLPELEKRRKKGES